MHRSSSIQGGQNMPMTSVSCHDPTDSKMHLGLVEPGMDVGRPDKREQSVDMKAVVKSPLSTVANVSEKNQLE